MSFIHKSSYVDDNVEIGKDVKIWHFCHIMSGSSIGDNSILGQNVMIGPKVKIGTGCKVQNNVSIYEGVELKKNVFVGHHVFLQMLLTPELLLIGKKSIEKL